MVATVVQVMKSLIVEALAKTRPFTRCHVVTTSNPSLGRSPSSYCLSNNYRANWQLHKTPFPLPSDWKVLELEGSSSLCLISEPVENADVKIEFCPAPVAQWYHVENTFCRSSLSSQSYTPMYAIRSIRLTDRAQNTALKPLHGT